MADNYTATIDAPQFAGEEIPPVLTKNYLFFLYLNTFFAGLLLSVLGLLLPAFIKDSIHNNRGFAGAIKGLLMNQN